MRNKAGADIKEMKDKSCEYCTIVGSPPRAHARACAWFFSCSRLMRCYGIHQVADVYQNGFLESWQDIAKIRKPIIAAVSGYAVSSSYYIQTTNSTNK
jgi:enoyl-CoA hydratase/carnithine racemase